jgi:Ca2+-binding RTX toxin-like protein
MPTSKAPLVSNLTLMETYGSAATNLTNLVIKDDVANATLTVQLSLSDPAAGAFVSGTGIVLTQAGRVATIIGTESEVNAVLATLAFQAAVSYTSPFSILIKVSDDDTRPNMVVGSRQLNFVSNGDDTVLIDAAIATATPIDGGDGSDTLVIGATSKPLNINLAASADVPQVVGAAGKYVGFEHVNAQAVSLAMFVTAHAAGSFIFTGSASDKITLGIGVDIVHAGAGTDTMVGVLSEGDEIDLGPGNENFVHSAAANAIVDGGEGNDTLLYSDPAAATLVLNATTSSTSYRNFETLAAGRATGDLTITAAGRVSLIATGKGNDVIDASAVESSITIAPASGNNTITTGKFADTITLGTGIDILNTGDGSDVIVGKLSTDDVINLQAGDDSFAFQSMAATTVDAGVGIDLLILTAARLEAEEAAIAVDLGAENSQQLSHEISAAVYKNFENLDASRMRTSLDVTAHANTTLIWTGKPGDVIDASAALAGVKINGGGGPDQITGSAYDDIIYYFALTELHEDYLAAVINGGTGTDTLVYAGSVEKYMDFSSVNDQLPTEVGVYKHFENLDAAASSARLTVIAGARTTSLITGRGVDNLDATLAEQAVSFNAGAGTNTIVGSAYGDSITLGSGVDIVAAGEGDDVVLGAATLGDQLTLGAGNDAIDYTPLRRGTLIDGGADIDTLGYRGAKALTINFTNANPVSGETALYQNFENLDAAAATGVLTVIASATTTSLVGGSADDVLTGAAGSQRLQGGAGNDTLNGGADADTYVFENNADANGIDSLGSYFVAGASAGADVLDFSAFLGGGSFASTVIEHSGSSDVAINNKVVLLATANGDVSATNTAAKVAALIEGNSTAMELAVGGKAVIITGDDSAATAGARIYYVDDSLGARVGIVEADDIGAVATLTVDIDTIVATNIGLALGALVYSGASFKEATANDGSIVGVTTITLSGDSFAGDVGDALGTVSNVPAGLNGVLVKATATTATLRLTGNATTHTQAADISNLTVSFANADFNSGSSAYITGLVKNNIGVDFKDPTPTFAVTDTAGVLTFSGTATGVITVAVDSNRVATFTRGGVAASTKPDLDSVTKLTLASGQTMELRAALLGGFAVDGAGTLAVWGMQNALAADLSTLTAATVTASFGESSTFVGDFGSAAVNMAAGKTLTLSASRADDATIGGAGSIVVTDFSAATAYALAGLSSSAGTVSIALNTGGILHADTTFNSSITLTLAIGVQLTGTAAQLHGVTVNDGSYTGNLVVTALGASEFDSSAIDINGTLVYHAQSGAITLAADTLLNPTAASSVTLNIANASTLTASAAQVHGVQLVAVGSGHVVITGADGAQTIQGTVGDDVIAGGKGDDVLSGAVGDDTYVFAASGALNDKDIITLVASEDVLDFSAFLTAGSVALNAGVLDVVSAASGNAVATAKVIGLDTGAAAPTAAALAALFKTTDSAGNNYLALANNGKAVIIHGDGTGASRVATFYYVNAGLDGTATDVSASDIVLVGVTSSNLSLGLLSGSNFDLT